jgi:hypothetical protein
VVGGFPFFVEEISSSLSMLLIWDRPSYSRYENLTAYSLLQATEDFTEKEVSEKSNYTAVTTQLFQYLPSISAFAGSFDSEMKPIFKATQVSRKKK